MKIKSHTFIITQKTLLKKSFRWMVYLGVIAGVLAFLFCLPDPLFETPYSTVLKDRQAKLMGAKIADDGQWRFPVSQEVPEKFQAAIIEFEDQNFSIHPGVDPVAIVRAAIQNYKAGKVVSGASTLTMQVMRLSKKDPPRTVWEKFKETIQAIRLEVSYSKDEIMALYAAHAPFGGNVVGLEAASWRYFGRNADQLSWAESAMLAVLPNSPALIHPGRNRDALKQKRDRLLERLYQQEKMDSLSYELSILEPLPEKPLDLPSDAPHVLAGLYTGKDKGKVFTSSIDQDLQQKVNKVVETHQRQLEGNNIHNASVVVLDVKRKEIAAYAGNTSGTGRNGYQVDVARAPRSTGSILKPFLYMLKLNEGEILPGTLVPDIPSQFSNYTPKNFSRTYDGAVHASEALARSLNVPAVHMLQEFGVPKFHHYLNNLGLTTITQPPEHYGLSLILGGAEGTLLDITSAYGSMAAMLNSYDVTETKSKIFHEIDFSLKSEERGKLNQQHFFALNAGAVWTTFEAMLNVTRPEDEVFWRRFQHSRKVAWKTGTSFGYRDGWAVGVTPEYVVGVWVGNADGEGRPNLTGIRSAGPVLFDVFDLLPSTGWFYEPVYEMKKIEVCRKSGHRAGQYCPVKDTVSVPITGLETPVCPYHRLVHVNQEKNQRVNSSCSDLSDIKTESWFVLPPVEEWYYKKNHPGYQNLPPLKTGCGEEEIATMKLVYPHRASVIYVPKELDGIQGKTVFEIAHRNSNERVFWHLDEKFLGETSRIHQMPLSPKPGKHTLTVVDEEGERLEYTFEVAGR